MQTYLTPKDIAARLQISVDTARVEMRKMRHKEIGKNGQILRVAEADFEAYMKPDPPLPRPYRQGKRTATPSTPPKRAIPYRRQEATEHV